MKLSMISSNEILSGNFGMKNAREIVVSTSIVILPKLASGYSHDYQVR